MKQKIEELLHRIEELKAQKIQDVEDIRVKLLGKKGEITKLFEDFREVLPEQKRELGQKLNVLKTKAAEKIEERMEQALAYVCCSAEESRVKVQKYCRKIYELGYVPICPRFGFSPFLEEGDAEDMQGYGRMSHILLRRCRMVVV